MFFPELLYQLSARDQQVTWLDPLLLSLDASSAAVDVFAVRAVPQGSALVLQALSVFADPGAGQNIVDQQLRIQDESGVSIVLKRDAAAAAANINRSIDWQGSILVPPNWLVVGFASFNAGVAANAVELNLVGVLIPIGNIQRV